MAEPKFRLFDEILNACPLFGSGVETVQIREDSYFVSSSVQIQLALILQEAVVSAATRLILRFDKLPVAL